MPARTSFADSRVSVSSCTDALRIPMVPVTGTFKFVHCLLAVRSSVATIAFLPLKSLQGVSLIFAKGQHVDLITGKQGLSYQFANRDLSFLGKFF